MIDKDKKKVRIFSDKNLQEVKTNIELAFVIGSQIRLRAKRSRFFGKCPFHADDKGKFVVSRKKQLWYCFGDCKRGGSIVDWVMAYEKLPLGSALRLLGERYPFLANYGQYGEANQTVPEKHPVLPHQKVIEQVLGHYQEQLYEHPRAVRYLHSLGLTQQTVEHYQIGYCDSSLFEMMANPQAEKKRDTSLLKEEFQQIGFLRHLASANPPVKERFHDMLVMPAKDEQGRFVQLIGRPVPDQFEHKHFELMVS